MTVIKFLPVEKLFKATEGMTILQAAQAAGIRQDAPCGGNGKCGKCKVKVEGKEVLACRTMIQDGMTVIIEEEPGKAEILSEGSCRKGNVCPVQDGVCHIGVDIGTTTVVAYLLDGKSGEILSVQSMLNPQFPYGSDVISRIQAALSGKLPELTKEIRECVWSLILRLGRAQGVEPEKIGTFAVVANPAMQQIFFGVSPENLAKPPFLPIFKQAESLPVSDYFPVESKGRLLKIPNIAGYVGSDTMGCILSTGMYIDTQATLMIDIGTNGEMVLGNCIRMAACSTAAGPALEGGRIACGMRGCEGAIDHVWLEDGELRYSVIGATQAKGICGSGIIDAVAVMLELGIINKRGRIQKDFREEGKERRYFLTENVFLTQDDIREVQMAKGAIAAGITLLAEHLEMDMEKIDRVFLCGAFGNYMNPESACRIGLIPAALLDKIQPGGNAAGMGSIQAAIDKEQFSLTESLLDKIEALELASVPGFQRVYAANMMFSCE